MLWKPIFVSTLLAIFSVGCEKKSKKSSQPVVGPAEPIHSSPEDEKAAQQQQKDIADSLQVGLDLAKKHQDMVLTLEKQVAESNHWEDKNKVTSDLKPTFDELKLVLSNQEKLKAQGSVFLDSEERVTNFLDLLETQSKIALSMQEKLSAAALEPVLVLKSSPTTEAQNSKQEILAKFKEIADNLEKIKDQNLKTSEIIFGKGDAE